MDIVSYTAEMSMQAAVKEVQALPHYESDGEVQMYIACVHVQPHIRCIDMYTIHTVT